MTEDLYLLKEEPVPEKALPEPEAAPAPDPLPVNEIPKDEPQVTGFNYLGENNRYFLVLIDDDRHAGIDSGHREMLMKIMGAKGLEMRDLAILNLAGYPGTDFRQLKEFFSCNKLVMFGIDPLKIGLPPTGANKPAIHADVKVLASFGLDEMSGSTDKKKEFWTVMKDF